MELQFCGYSELVFVTVCQFLTGSMAETEINAKCQLFHITIRKISLCKERDGISYQGIRHNVIREIGISVLS